MKDRLAKATEAAFRASTSETMTYAEAAAMVVAALPALAEDPDAKRRVREAIHGYACGCERPWPFDPRYDAVADAVLAALFGVASPSTKETG